MIVLKEVKSKKDLKKFIKFQNYLYKNNPYYVPPLIADEMAMFDPKKNGSYEWSDVYLFLAYQDKRIVGRVAGIFNRKYAEKVGKKQMRITRFDFIDDYEVSKTLIDKIKEIALTYDAHEIIGPIGFSDLDKEGMLIDGFDQLSMYITIYNHEYYLDHMKKLGFEKECDWFEYQIAIPDHPLESLDRIANRTIKKFGYKVRKFASIKEATPAIYEGIDIMNVVYNKLYGYTAISERQKKEFMSNFKTILNVEYLYAIYNDKDELIGYGLLAPSVSKAMQKCKGKLTLKGIISLLKTMKHHDVVDLYSIGVRPEYMGNGVNVIILNEGIKSCIKNGVKFAETGPELETNAEVQAQWKLFNAKQHKKRRCWIMKF